MTSVSRSRLTIIQQRNDDCETFLKNPRTGNKGAAGRWMMIDRQGLRLNKSGEEKKNATATRSLRVSAIGLPRETYTNYLIHQLICH